MLTKNKMDKERIAIWVAIGILFILVIFRTKLSNYSLTDQSNIMDLAEFRNIPREIKDVYNQLVVNRLAAELGNVVTADWNRMTPVQKREWRNMARQTTERIIDDAKRRKGSPETVMKERMKSGYTMFAQSGYSLFDPSLLKF